MYGNISDIGKSPIAEVDQVRRKVNNKMRIYKSRLLFILLCLFVSTPVMAAPNWSAPLTVEDVNTEGFTDLIYVTTSGGSSYGNASCIVNKWIIETDSNKPDRKNRAYSMLLAAVVSGKKVRLWYTDSCSTWNYHKATNFKLVR